MAGKKVGVDIGRGTMKIVCGSLKKGKFTMYGYRILKTPKGAFLENENINEKAFLEDDMTQNIADAVKNIGCKGKKCNMSISGRNIVIRERKLPVVPEKELGEMVRLEAQSFLPGPSEDFVVDYRVIDKLDEGEGELIKVLIAAAPLEMVESYIGLLEKSGLKVESVDIQSSCITNYAKNYILEDDLNTLIVDIGAVKTRFVMYNGRQYFAEIEVEIGGDEATTASIQILGISQEELEHRKVEKGKIVADEDLDLSLNDEDVYFNLGIKKTYEKIAQEISRVMDYYRTRRFSSKIDRVVMIGGGSNLSGAPEYIQSIAGVPVSLVEIPDDLKGIFVGESPKEDFATIILALGAVLRGK